ncbi:hypothetical protein GCM10022399_42410 [Terrabacter ginsenosidimutans]|uniref:Uncharacterized protein n=1 Tax=Terrabacter ginsenosidimutans TaxID=490575 RepID=A0ABP7ET01_9MICO
MDLVYNRSLMSDELVVFASRPEAEAVSAIWNAIKTAATWEGFIKMMPATEWAAIMESQDNEMPTEGPFEADRLPGYSDGDYPQWLAAKMRDALPRVVREKYGQAFDSVLNGPAMDLQWSDAEAIAEDLRGLGYRVEYRPDLKLA